MAENGSSRHEWTPNEIVLTICAHHEIKAAPTQRGTILDDLAKELGCGRDQVEAAVTAVSNDALRSKMLKLLLGCEPDNLLQNAQWACKEAEKIRKKMP